MSDEIGNEDIKQVGGRDFELMLKDYRMTLAEILYHMPDHPSLLQAFIWQDLDVAPKYPVLHKFLGFWENNIAGRLHSVRVDSAKLITPSELGVIGQTFALH
jgi:uncharacterized protein Usg